MDEQQNNNCNQRMDEDPSPEGEAELIPDPGPSSRANSQLPPPVTPGIKDSDGFLTPPPASTLLIRRTRTNSTGPSTYVAASSLSSLSVPPNTVSDQPLPKTADIRKSFSVPYMRLQNKPSRDRKSEPPFKRMSFDKKVNVLLTPQTSNPHVTINVPNNNGAHRSSFPPISPLAIDPSHALSVTLSSDRSISTVIPIDALSQPSTSASAEFPYPTHLPSTSSTVANISSGKDIFNDVDKSKARGGSSKSTPFLVSKTQLGSLRKNVTVGRGGKGKPEKRKRGERGPDRFPNIDPNTGRRKYIRKKRFTLDKRQSSRARLSNSKYSSDRSSYVYDVDIAGKWRPTDDLRLIVNVLQTNDLDLVHKGVKFSCKYTLENIEARWVGLLYDKAITKVSQHSIRNLHPRVIADIYSKSLFSVEEDRVIKTISSTHDPKCVMPVLDKLLKDNALAFLKWRTSKILLEHWLHLREHHLLCDQSVSDYFDQESFSEFEDSLTDQEIRGGYDVDLNVRKEMLVENKHTKKLIRTLEEEVSKWQVLADMVTEIDKTPFEEESLAMLRGKHVRYLMRSREISLGRRTAESLDIDADLSLEGSTYKVSRKQATIQLRSMGDFAIWNQGKHGIYVDGNMVMPGKLGVLVDQSVVEISQLRFVFLINHKTVAEERKKLIRLEVKKEMARLSKIARFIKAYPAYPIGHPSHPYMDPGPSSQQRIGIGSIGIPCSPPTVQPQNKK